MVVRDEWWQPNFAVIALVGGGRHGRANGGASSPDRIQILRTTFKVRVSNLSSVEYGTRVSKIEVRVLNF